MKRKKLFKLITTSIASMGAIGGGVIALSSSVNKNSEQVKVNNIQPLFGKEISAIQGEYTISSLFNELTENKAIMTVDLFVQIFKKYNIPVRLQYGTSRNYGSIGNKYHDIDEMVKNIKEATGDITMSVLTDGVNVRYHIPAQVAEIINKALGSVAGQSTNHHSSGNSGNNNKPPSSSLVITDDDAKWVEGLTKPYFGNYPNNVEGNNFYQQQGEYKEAPSMDEWINTFQTPSSQIGSLFSSTAPHNYSARNKQFVSIYGPQSTIPTVGLYSGCSFGIDATNHNRIYDTQSCSLTDPKGTRNGWEHVTPQSNIKASAGAWINQARGDLHNIRPAMQNEFNGPRSNYPFGIVSGDSLSHGIDFEVGKSALGWPGLVVEPRPSVRGDVARIIFYMHDIYHITYAESYYESLILWASLDPADDYEKQLDSAIAKEMGLHNPYVTGERLLPILSNIDPEPLGNEIVQPSIWTNGWYDGMNQLNIAMGMLHLKFKINGIEVTTTDIEHINFTYFICKGSDNKYYKLIMDPEKDIKGLIGPKDSPDETNFPLSELNSSISIYLA